MLSLSLFSFNSGYLYQVVVRIPLRFARVIRLRSGWRLGRAYGARPFILHIHLKIPLRLARAPTLGPMAVELGALGAATC